MEQVLADFSIVSLNEINTLFSFEINTNGKPFRNFKLSSEGPFYRWSKTSMQCVTADGGRKFGMERMLRADGLVAMNIVSKRSVKSRSITCQMSGKIDPGQVESVLAKMASGDYFLSIPLPAVTNRVSTLTATIHFPGYITPDDIKLDDMTAEEFEADFFPSALTLRATSIPPHQVKTLEMTIRHGTLEKNPAFYGSLEPSDEQLAPFVGMKKHDKKNFNFSLVVFISSFFMFSLLVIRGQSKKLPYLLFSSIGGPTRALFTLCLIMLFALFTLSGVFIEAMVFLTCCVIIQLPAGSPDSSRGPGEAQPQEPPEVDARVGPVEEAPHPQRPRRSFFDIRGAFGMLFLVLFAAAGATSCLLVSAVSVQASQNLAAAYVLCSLYLFFSPEMLFKTSGGSPARPHL